MENMTLRVRPQVLMAKANELTSERNSLSSMMEDVKGKLASLTGTWQSVASDEFQARFRQVHNDIEGMLAVVAEYAKDLNDAAVVYERAEQTVKSTVQTTSTGGVFNN